MIITLHTICKLHFEYKTYIYILLTTITETRLYFKYLHIQLHFFKRLSSKGTSPKLYKKVIWFILNLAKIYKYSYSIHITLT